MLCCEEYDVVRTRVLFPDPANPHCDGLHHHLDIDFVRGYPRMAIISPSRSTGPHDKTIPRMMRHPFSKRGCHLPPWAQMATSAQRPRRAPLGTGYCPPAPVKSIAGASSLPPCEADRSQGPSPSSTARPSDVASRPCEAVARAGPCCRFSSAERAASAVETPGNVGSPGGHPSDLALCGRGGSEGASLPRYPTPRGPRGPDCLLLHDLPRRSSLS